MADTRKGKVYQGFGIHSTIYIPVVQNIDYAGPRMVAEMDTLQRRVRIKMADTRKGKVFQGYDNMCDDPSLLYRIETMPGLE